MSIHSTYSYGLISSTLPFVRLPGGDSAGDRFLSSSLPEAILPQEATGLISRASFAAGTLIAERTKDENYELTKLVSMQGLMAAAARCSST